MITNTEHYSFHHEEIIALERIIAVAKRKPFFACFIANSYDTHYLCDVRSCVRYMQSESNSELHTGFYLMLKLAAMGVESHEYLGRETVTNLIDEWSLQRQ